MIVTVACVPVSAISETCLEDHFSKLNFTQSNHPATPPSNGSCMYAALSLLLTFYDSYWHPDFVPGKYEWQSGIYSSYDDALTRTFTAMPEAEAWDNYEKANNIPDNEVPIRYLQYVLDNAYNLQSISSTHHQQVCACGWTNGEASEHIMSRYLYKSKMLHSKICACGYTETAPHSIVADSDRVAHCTDCGAVFDITSDIIIKKNDPECVVE